MANHPGRTLQNNRFEHAVLRQRESHTPRASDVRGARCKAFGEVR